MAFHSVPTWIPYTYSFPSHHTHCILHLQYIAPMEKRVFRTIHQLVHKIKDASAIVKVKIHLLSSDLDNYSCIIFKRCLQVMNGLVCEILLKYSGYFNLNFGYFNLFHSWNWNFNWTIIFITRTSAWHKA